MTIESVTVSESDDTHAKTTGDKTADIPSTTPTTPTTAFLTSKNPPAIGHAYSGPVADPPATSTAPPVELPPVVDGIAGTVRTMFGLPAASTTPGTGNGPAPLFSLGMLWFAWRPEHVFFNQSPAIGEPPVVVATGPKTTGTITGTDADGDRLTYTVVDGPDHGTVTVSDDGSFVYTSTGTPTDDAFVVRISDRDSGPHFHGLESLWALFTGDSPHDTDVTVSIVAPVAPWTLSPPAADGTVTGVSGTHADGDIYSVDGVTSSAPDTYVLDSGATVVFATDQDGAYTGAFTYTPSPWQRWTAGDTDDAVTDPFTIVHGHADGTDTVAEVAPEVLPSDEFTLDIDAASSRIGSTADHIYWSDNLNVVTIFDRATGDTRTVTLPDPARGLGGMMPLPTDSDRYAVYAMYQGRERGVAVIDLDTGQSSFYSRGVDHDTYSSAAITQGGTALITTVSNSDESWYGVVRFLLADPSNPQIVLSGSGHPGHAAYDEAPDGTGFAMVDDVESIRIAHVDQDGRQIRSWTIITRGNTSNAVSADGPVPFLVSQAGDTVTVFVLIPDTTPAGVSMQATDALIGSDGQSVYLLNEGESTTQVVAYRPETGQPSPEVTVTGTVLGKGVTDDGRVWLATVDATDPTVATITYVDADGATTTSTLQASGSLTDRAIIRIADVFAAVDPDTNRSGPITLLRPTATAPLAPVAV
ncbi:hypothetical protein ACH46_16405 [Gordonia phthalatica]|uniref:Cadherin domain-containing protein n=1 Tax=Gordonia phthalatica TaxID=1136941 RepID=A0A0N9NIQ3_9ACTN|nr:hypothetical protein ACH46_16405 [Gordonia phthalatica]